MNAALDIGALILGVTALIGCLCRLDTLQWGRHRSIVIVMHIAMGAACASTLYRAWSDSIGLIDYAACISVLSWLRLSVATWGSGAVPVQFDTAPAELDEADYRYVSGGRK